MTAATGIEIATGGNAQSLYQATPQSTGLTATDVSQTAATASFRSSWQSLLASLGSGLDGTSGNEAGTDAAKASTGAALAKTAGAEATTSVSQAVLATLPIHSGKALGTATASDAAISETSSRSTTAALKTASGFERQTASTQTDKNTAKADAAESTTNTHSARNAKHETDSTGATEQVSAVPDSAPQFLAISVQQVTIATSSDAAAAAVAGTANLQASEDAPVISFGVGDAAKGMAPFTSRATGIAGDLATNEVGKSGLSGKASLDSAAAMESEEVQAGETADADFATGGALSRSTLRDPAPASGTAKSLATSSSQVPANPGMRSVTSNLSPAPTEASVSSGSETEAIGKGEATRAQIPVQAASEKQIQSLPSSNGQAQSAGAETLAITAGGDGVQAVAAVTDLAKSQSSQTPAIPSIGKKAGVASAGRTSEQAVSRSSQSTGTAAPMQLNGLSTAGQSGLAAQDGAGLVRDSSVGHGSSGTTGNTAGELAASAADREVSASRETFSALDAGPPTTPTWIHAGTQRAEAGFQDPSLGWIGVRADSSGGSVHASLVAGSADAAQTLSGHLAGLNAYLADQHSAVGSVTVATSEDRSGTYSMDQSMNQQMNQGAGQDGSRGQQSVPAVSVPAFTSAVSAVSAARTEVSAPGASLGGTHVSLIA